MGILFLGIAGQESEVSDLSVKSLINHARTLSPLWLKISFLFAVVGYSVKMGIAPLFTVNIDAKDAAPSPIGALFSGGLLNVGFIAILRFYEIYSYTDIKIWVENIMLLIGMVSLVFAMVYLMKVKNIKRMLAYSSVENARLALVVCSTGQYGVVLAITQLLVHSLVKSALFFQAGQIYRAFMTKDMWSMGRYFDLNPAGALIYLLCVLTILGMPPGALFFTELSIFAELFKKLHWGIPISLLAILTFIFGYILKSTLQVLFGEPSRLGELKRIPAYESVSQYAL